MGASAHVSVSSYAKSKQSLWLVRATLQYVAEIPLCLRLAGGGILGVSKRRIFRRPVPWVCSQPSSCRQPQRQYIHPPLQNKAMCVLMYKALRLGYSISTSARTIVTVSEEKSPINGSRTPRFVRMFSSLHHGPLSTLLYRATPCYAMQGGPGQPRQQC